MKAPIARSLVRADNTVAAVLVCIVQKMMVDLFRNGDIVIVRKVTTLMPP